MSPNTAVVVGSTATFSCVTNYRTVCFVYRQNTSDIFDKVDVCRKKYDNKFIRRCNVTTASSPTGGTRSTLTITDVALTDAGFYSCGDCFDEETAHLLVLGKKDYGSS